MEENKVENNEENNKFENARIHLILVILLLLFLISFGKWNYLEEKKREERKKNLEEKRAQVEKQSAELELILNDNLDVKHKLEQIYKNVIGATSGIIVLFGVVLFAILDYFGWCIKEILGCFTIIGLVLFCIGILATNNWMSAKEIYELYKKQIRIWIYRKYINLDIEIEKDSGKLMDLKELKKEIDEELSSI